MTTITRERLLKIQQWSETYGAGSNVMLPAEEAEELARIALASLTAEPVAWTDEEELRDLRKVGFCEMFSVEPISKDADMLRVIPLYRHAQPAPEREQIRREHAEWSDATFGDVGPVGPLKHLSKEALESAAEPGDLSEWADMQFLLWDAQRRAGISDEQITQALIEKLAINKARQWPEPKDGEPRLHIKEQPAPVVPDGLRQALSNAGIAAPESDEMLAATCEKYIQMLVTWVKDRKPFQPAPVMPVVQCPFPCGWDSLNELVVQDAAVVVRGLVDGEVVTEANRQAVIANNDRLLRVIAACRAAMLQSKYRDLSQPVDPQISEYEKIMGQAGNSPVIPDGYALVPVEPTDEMIVAAMDSDDVTYNESDDTVFYVHHCEIYKAMLAAAPQPEGNNG